MITKEVIVKVELLTKTIGVNNTPYEGKSLDEIIVAIARISSGKTGEDLFATPEKLIRYCLLNGHWSIFDTCNLGFEITTSRDMARQLLRHWSIKKQEYSARYAEVTEFEPIELRYQGNLKNRQSSIDKVEDSQINTVIDKVIKAVQLAYNLLIELGVSKETARFILPGTSQTKLYMNGTVREFITLLNQRLHKTAQKEVRLIAEGIRDIFKEECPVISESLYYFDNAYEIHILERLVLERYGVYEEALNKME